MPRRAGPSLQAEPAPPKPARRAGWMRMRGRSARSVGPLTHRAGAVPTVPTPLTTNPRPGVSAPPPRARKMRLADVARHRRHCRSVQMPSPARASSAPPPHAMRIHRADGARQRRRGRTVQTPSLRRANSAPRLHAARTGTPPAPPVVARNPSAPPVGPWMGIVKATPKQSPRRNPRRGARRMHPAPGLRAARAASRAPRARDDAQGLTDPVCQSGTGPIHRL